MKTLLGNLNPFGRTAPAVEIALEDVGPAAPRLGSPVFVIGAPRSGTTWINTILNRHSRVFITNELRFMLFYHEAIVRGADRLANARAKDDFIAHFKGDVRPQLESFFIRHVTKESLKTRMKRSLAGPEPIGPGCLWGDKNPFVGRAEYEGLTRLMEEIFPDASYVHIYRDPRNSISSRMTRGKDTVDNAVRDWRTIFESCRALGARAGAKRYHEVRYEELCSERDEEIVTAMFSFLGLETEPEIIEFLREQDQERTPAGTPATGNEDIGDVDVFRKRLDPEQVAAIESGLGDLIDALGYPR